MTALLMSCKTQQTIETLQKSSVKQQEQAEYKQATKDSSKTYTYIDSIVVEEYTPAEVTEGKEIHNHSTSNGTAVWKSKQKRTIKVYGIKRTNLSGQQQTTEIQQDNILDSTVSHAQISHTDKKQSDGIFIGIIITMLCLLLVAGLVAWKIAVQ